MFKRWLAAVIVAVFCLSLVIAFWLVGNYFVEYALKRGTPEDPKAVPLACSQILDPSVEVQEAPPFEREVWHQESFDGLQLAATHFIPAAVPGHRWVIVVHGYGRTQNSVWDIASRYLAEGFEVLTPDLRAAGDSEGIYLTMGCFESRDVKGWVAAILQQDPGAQVLLHGVSMGAATVLQAAALDLPPNVRGVVADCSYSSAYEMFSRQLGKMYGLPAFPVMNIVNVVCRIQAGFYISDAAPLREMGRVRVPLLFIHGSEDVLAPPAMLEDLYAAAGSEKERLLVNGASHASSRWKDPAGYYGRVFAFSGKQMP